MDSPEKRNNQTAVAFYPQLTSIPDYSHHFVGLGEELDAYKFAMEDKNYLYASELMAGVFSKVAALVSITANSLLKEMLHGKDYQETPSKVQPTQREIQASIRRKYVE